MWKGFHCHLPMEISKNMILKSVNWALEEPLTNFYFIRHILLGLGSLSRCKRKIFHPNWCDVWTTLGTCSPGPIRWRNLASTWHLHESRWTCSLWVLSFLPLFLAWNLSLLAGSLVFLIASWRFLKSANNSDWLRLFSLFEISRISHFWTERPISILAICSSRRTLVNSLSACNSAIFKKKLPLISGFLSLTVWVLVTRQLLKKFTVDFGFPPTQDLFNPLKKPNRPPDVYRTKYARRAVQILRYRRR